MFPPFVTLSYFFVTLPYYFASINIYIQAPVFWSCDSQAQSSLGENALVSQAEGEICLLCFFGMGGIEKCVNSLPVLRGVVRYTYI